MPDDHLKPVDAYELWIRLSVKGDGYSQCEEITLAMGKEFPELQRRKGIYHDAEWGRRSHWWLRDQDRNIVDPTGKQFPTGCWFPSSDSLYTDLTVLTDDEIKKMLPSGKCANCGEAIYGGSDTVCSDSCGSEFAASIAAELF